MSLIYFHLKSSPSRALPAISSVQTFKRQCSNKAPEKIVRSPAPTLDLQKGNLTNFMLQYIRKFENRTVMECVHTKKQFSYGQLAEQITIWSGFLKQMGVSKGDEICIITPNCTQYASIFFGTTAIGASVSPINAKSTPEEIQRMLKINGAKFIVFSSDVEEKLMKALEGKTDGLTLCSVGKSSLAGVVNVDEILDGTRPIQPVLPEELNGEETAFMPFSSGTTGPPKAVALSQNAFIANIQQFLNPYHAIFEDTPDQEVIMAMMPFFHIYGMLVILMLGIVRGRKLVIIPQFDPRVFINTITEYKVDHLHAVPSLLNLLNNSSECNPETMGHISSLVCGAAPVHASSVRTFRKKIKKDVHLFEGYGLTESLVTNHTARHCPQLGTSGQLFSNTEGKIINTETEETLAAYEHGEICLKTPSVMKGYVNNPKGTNEILRNGWIHTGDIGYYDEEGMFFIVDRTKDLIKVQGMQVSPSELEEELLKHPNVKECAVVAVPDAVTGEAPKAFVVRDGNVTEKELKEFVEAKISTYKHLRGGVAFLESLPKSETGKVLRRVLQS